MVQKVTRGIKISVQTNFEGTFYRNDEMAFAFSYQITIENQSKNNVQLTQRYWRIDDSLAPTEFVKGEGVIGQKPVLPPGKSHTYNSGCLLASSLGRMSGYYTMVCLHSTQQFKVNIPSFILCAPFTLN